MIKKLKAYLLRAAAAAMLFAPAAMPAVASAQIDDGLCSGSQLSVQQRDDCDADADGSAGESIDGIIQLAINMFSLVVGVISVIMIIIGGLKYITSGGEGTNIQGAKNTILYAIIGLVVVALAQIVVRFVLSQTGDATNTL